MVMRRAAAIAVVCSLAFAAPAGAHVYWTEFPNTIGRANLDGTDANHAFVTIDAAAYALDVDGRHVYWSLFGPGAIGCRTRVIRGTATSTTRGRARATLTRHGRRVASGTAIRNRLVLGTRGRLRAGRYTLTLRSRRGPAVRMRVTIR